MQFSPAFLHMEHIFYCLLRYSTPISMKIPQFKIEYIDSSYWKDLKRLYIDITNNTFTRHHTASPRHSQKEFFSIRRVIMKITKNNYLIQ